MSTALHDRLAEALAATDQRHERRRLVASTPQPNGRVDRDGRVLLDFSSNDYLGLAHHPLLRERAADWALRFGAGSGASRLVTGTLPIHGATEAKLAAFKRTEAALIFGSGWQANAAVLAAVLAAAPDTIVFADRLIHASLHAGLARIRQLRFRHNDLDHLETLLAAAPAGTPRLIVTESVFSMDGDRVDLPRLAAIADTHGAFLYLDEAHATGVLGPDGAGLSAELPGAVDLVMGTFSKAFGGYGAYVAGSRLVCDFVINRCGGFIFTTAPPPALLGAIDAALDLIPAMAAERDRLASHGDRVRSAAHVAGFDTAASSTQIVPLIIGCAEDALAVAARFEAAGLLAAAIRAPTVPRGTSRLRLALRASHEDADVDRLIDRIARERPQP